MISTEVIQLTIKQFMNAPYKCSNSQL